MRKLTVLCFAFAGALALSATAASAQEVHMIANLTGAEEAPNPVATGAFGTADVTVDVANRSVKVVLSVFNLPTGSTAGHIHAGGKGAAGPVILDFTFPPGRTGDFNLVFNLTQSDLRPRPDQGILTMDDAMQAIAAGNAYVNVHTTAFPGGEIRGQLQAQK